VGGGRARRRGGGQRAHRATPRPARRARAPHHAHALPYAHADPRSSSLAIRILYKSHIPAVLEKVMETLWDLADQVGPRRALGTVVVWALPAPP
jgi:hypothetical protein